MNDKAADGVKAEAPKTEAAKPKPNTVTLNKPVKFGDETVSELTYREPTGADIQACGVPLKPIIHEDGRVEYNVDAAAMGRMMSALYAQPPSFIGKLSANDWTTCAWAVAGFFTVDFSRI